MFTIQVVAWMALAVGFTRSQRRDGSVGAAGEQLDLPITVIVAARNEAERLPALLDALAEQTHAPAEVLVADDGSTDDTAAFAAGYADQLPVRVVRIADGDAEAAGLPRKKHALSRAIA
ncbi:MAG: glycosyltransferase family A protein, partial [Bacteroidota bacterium]